MFILLIFFIIYLIKFQRNTELVENNDIEQVLSMKKIVSFLLLGGFSLWLGSETLIKGAVSLAESMGVSERIISVSIVSLGTSIPELTASILQLSIKKRQFLLVIWLVPIYLI